MRAFFVVPVLAFAGAFALALVSCGGTPPKPKGPPPEYEEYDAGTVRMESPPAAPPAGDAPLPLEK